MIFDEFHEQPDNRSGACPDTSSGNIKTGSETGGDVSYS